MVHDDAAIVEMLEEALADHSYQILAACGARALAVAHGSHPAVILLDLTMPGMDGVEVSRRLRADPATAHIPIVGMSAHDRLRVAGAW